MGVNTLRFTAVLVLGTAPLMTPPAFACGSRPHAASLCKLTSGSVDVRRAPDGRVEYAASGEVLVTGHSTNGLWARIEVPCIGYKGWIRSENLACEAPSAGLQLSAEP